jgi:Protein of unknown function (DUF1579)
MKRITFAAVSLAAASAFAQAPPPPAPEMATLKAFDGTFACTGESPASPFGPAHKTEGTVKGGADLGGYWFILRYEEKKTAANPQPVTAQLTWGYDGAQKKFIGNCIDSFGSICHETSAGWQGDTLVWEGEMMAGGQKMPVRDTFNRKGTTIVHKGEMQSDGKWMVFDEETCIKK